MTQPNESLVIPMPTSPAWLATEASAAPRILAQVNAVQVSDATSMQVADDMAKMVLKLRDKLEAERKTVTGPLLEAKKRVDSWFKPVTDILDQAARMLKNKVATFTIEQERERDRLYREAAQLHAAGQHQAMTQALVATSAAIVEPPKGTSVREEWRAEVFNPSIVPCSYHCVDVARIEREARATPPTEEPVPIAGVRYTKIPVTTMRR